MSEAIIGVIGTLLGTILGWILGRIDFGRLRISFDNTTYEFSVPGSMCYIPGVKSNEIYLYKFSTTMQLFNGSNTNRVVRTVQMIFNDGKQDLLLIDADNDDTKRYATHAIFYDKMDIANIPEHTGVDLKMHICTGDIDNILKTKKIFIQYKNQNLKTKRIFLKNVDYSKQPRFIEEEENNG